MDGSAPARILLVDDDEALGRYLARVLTRGGFEVTHELDSGGALHRIETESWDLLITDIELPGMTGLELLDRVRQRLPDLPVAVLTGHPTVDYAVSALRNSAAEFLQKPIIGADQAQRARESQEAADVIGARLFLDDLEDTRIAEGDPTIGAISRVVEELQPTVVYTHSIHDIHQDHRNTHRAAMVACRRVGRVYCFQSPSATVEFRPTHFVAIDDQVGRKLKAIGTFGSQAVRDYLEPDLIAATARYWSRYCDGSHAEPFEAIRDRSARPPARSAVLPAQAAFSPEIRQQATP